MNRHPARAPLALRRSVPALFGAAVVATAVGLAAALGVPPAAAAPAPHGVATAVAAGSHVDGKNFTLDLVPAGDCASGAECTLYVKLAAAGDYHVNDAYPYKFKAQDSAGVEFLGKDAGGKNIFSKAAGDFKKDGEKAATMAVRFKAAAKGKVTVSGEYKLSVCSAQNCQLETQSVSAEVTVK